MSQHSEMKTTQRLILSAIFQILVPVVLIGAYIILMTNSWDQFFSDYEGARQRSNLVRLVTMMKGAISDPIESVRRKYLTPEQASNAVQNIIRNMTYQDDFGNNYFFMIDDFGNGLVNPFSNYFEGVNHWNDKDSQGNYYVQEIIQVAQSNESGGFVTYDYPLPGSTEVQQKISYVVSIPEIHAIIGTGIYLESYWKIQGQYIEKIRITLLSLITLAIIGSLFSIYQFYRSNHVLAQEILERRKAQIDTQLAEKNLLTVFDSIYDGIVIHDSQGKIVKVNQRLIDIYQIDGNPLEKTLFDFSSQVITDELREAYTAVWQSVADGNERIFEAEGKRVRTSEIFDIEIGLRPILWYGNKMVLSVIRDVSERKANERSLLDSEERFRTVVEQLAEGLTLIDESGKILEWNAAFEEMVGIRRESVLNQNIWDVQFSMLPPVQRTIETFEKIRSLGQRVMKGDEEFFSRPYRQELMTPKGENRVIEQYFFAIHSSKGRRTATIFRDITEQQRVQQHIENELRKIKSLQRIDVSIISQKPLKETLTLVIQEAKAHLPIDGIRLLSLDDSGKHLFEVAHEGTTTEVQECFEYQHRRGLSWETAQSKKLFWFIETDPEGHFCRDCIKQDDFKTYIGVPIFSNTGLIGLIEAFLKQPAPYDNEWAEYLVTLAGQAAIAVETNAMLQNLAKTNEKLSEAYEATIAGWSKALELRDEETQGHSDRVTRISMELANRIGIEGDDLVNFKRGVLLHDIGKMGIPDHILLKPGPLNEKEWAIMKQHPRLAYNLLSPISYLKPALDIPYYHHERWNGSGYPHGLKGEEIPLSARIFMVVDVWDALIVDRPYRTRWSEEQVRGYLLEQAGILFDPQIVNAFLALMGEKRV